MRNTKVNECRKIRGVKFWSPPARMKHAVYSLKKFKKANKHHKVD